MKTKLASHITIAVDQGLSIDQLPQECIEDCGGSGDVTESVQYWCRRLSFTVDRKLATAYLKCTGAWSAEELSAAGDDTLAERVLWMAACDFREFQTNVARGYKPEDVPSGTAYFYMGI